MNSYLEEEYRPAYEAWQSDKTPKGNAVFLKAIAPVVQKGLQMYGGDSPLAASKAKLIALKAAEKYDPSRSRLQSHMLNNMQELRRVQRKQQEIIKAPERVLLESQKLKSYSQELEDTTGREPTDAELSDYLGISLDRLSKIRSFQPGISSSQAETETDSGDVLSPESRLPGPSDSSHWVEIVYSSLSPLDQKIMELGLGLHGHKKLSNIEIAKKLNRSPGAITQRKVKIQQILDQEQELSPFVG